MGTIILDGRRKGNWRRAFILFYYFLGHWQGLKMVYCMQQIIHIKQVERQKGRGQAIWRSFSQVQCRRKRPMPS
jgi:hypothetical protein